MYVSLPDREPSNTDRGGQDKLIMDFIPRVIPNVQQLLVTTKQRLGILPGPSTIDTVRNISDIQDVLRRKVSAL